MDLKMPEVNWYHHIYNNNAWATLGVIMDLFGAYLLFRGYSKIGWILMIVGSAVILFSIWMPDYIVFG